MFLLIGVISLSKGKAKMKNQARFFFLCGSLQATTSCKNVETLPQKNDLSCFKSLLVTGL